MTSQFSTIDAAVAAIAPRRSRHRRRRRRPRKRGRFHLRRRKGDARNRQFHDHARPRAALHAAPARGLRAAQAAPDGRVEHGPAGHLFTVPVDHRTSKTGITAQERARTIQAIVDPHQQAERFRPARALVSAGGQRRGRAAPGRAYRGGRRSGPAGRPGPGRRAVRNSRRRTATGPTRDAAVRAGRTSIDLEIISIDELIRYRRVREKLVYRIAEAELPTRYGHFKLIFYGVKYEAQQPFVLVMGDLDKVGRCRWCGSIRPASPATCSASLRCDCGDQLHMALEMIGQEGAGVLVYLPQEGRGIGLIEKIKAYHLARRGARHGRSQPGPGLSRPTSAITASASNCSRTWGCRKSGC